MEGEDTFRIYSNQFLVSDPCKKTVEWKLAVVEPVTWGHLQLELGISA